MFCRIFSGIDFSLPYLLCSLYATRVRFFITNWIFQYFVWMGRLSHWFFSIVTFRTARSNWRVMAIYWVAMRLTSPSRCWHSSCPWYSTHWDYSKIGIHDSSCACNWHGTVTVIFIFKAQALWILMQNVILGMLKFLENYLDIQMLGYVQFQYFYSII